MTFPSPSGLRAAHRKALDKLARQEEAVAATRAEVQLWEKAVKDAEADLSKVYQYDRPSDRL